MSRAQTLIQLCEAQEWWFIKDRQGDWEKSGPYTSVTAAIKAVIYSGNPVKISNGFYEINKKDMDGNISRHAVVTTDNLASGGWDE